MDREATPDPIDAADYYREAVVDDAVAQAMRKAAEIPEGMPGDCDLCGEHFGRLVNGACGFCRDKYKLP